jgi:hypothetical protein
VQLRRATDIGVVDESTCRKATGGFWRLTEPTCPRAGRAWSISPPARGHRQSRTDCPMSCAQGPAYGPVVGGRFTLRRWGFKSDSHFRFCVRSWSLVIGRGRGRAMRQPALPAQGARKGRARCGVRARAVSPRRYRRPRRCRTSAPTPPPRPGQTSATRHRAQSRSRRRARC